MPGLAIKSFSMSGLWNDHRLPDFLVSTADPDRKHFTAQADRVSFAAEPDRENFTVQSDSGSYSAESDRKHFTAEPIA